ncbi:iron-sulfur cluster assembly protein [Metallosphaera javensis (ex Sakai et al. 2022)]|uniref:iron-sulfur cluster assembly protein n=1 Tax=Metallosphaera javensis (ex Sakai et al. 2022) TaxID=2775498 RepID=UPI002587C37B|nr:MAG: metal-sulfur cluster biosynthetic enzyme [Metallosphaera javensis (ex Sakai et al. 2022)]
MDPKELLDNVIDPETSFSISKLGFVKEISINQYNNSIRIVLSPPTFFCPPLFLYMILEDVKRTLRSQYTEVIIEVMDHHDSKKLTDCINKGIGFDECYKSEVERENYGAIKRIFNEKREKAKSNQLTRLSLDLNGEFCKLISEAKRNESVQTS